jgi:hypothetical protein
VQSIILSKTGRSSFAERSEDRRTAAAALYIFGTPLAESNFAAIAAAQFWLQLWILRDSVCVLWLLGGSYLPVCLEKTLIAGSLENEKRPACDGWSLIAMTYILIPTGKFWLI